MLNSKYKPFASTNKFNGKIYHYEGFALAKSDAEKIKNKYQESGYLVRISKKSKAYVIYARKK